MGRTRWRWRSWCGRCDAELAQHAEDLPGGGAGGHAQPVQRAVGLGGAEAPGEPSERGSVRVHKQGPQPAQDAVLGRDRGVGLRQAAGKGPAIVAQG